MNLTMKSGKCVINGRSFRGNNVCIPGNQLIIDGVVQDGEMVGDITVTVHGDVETIENTNGNVKANNVGNIKTTNGKVTCDDVSGDIKTTNGDVVAKKVFGKVSTVNGDIN